MPESVLMEEYFGLKHFENDEPSHSCGLEELGHRAHEKHEAICRGEQTLAPTYWELGQLLTLARKQVNRGQWEVFLVEHGINRVRACRAQTIFRTFSTVEEVSGLTVEDAYDKRPKRQVHRRAKKSSPSSEKAGNQERPQLPQENTVEELDSYLTDVSNGIDRFMDLIAFMNLDERKQRFSLYQTALKQLQELGRLLGVQDRRRRSGKAAA